MSQIKKFRQDFTEVKTSTAVFKWTLYDVLSCNKKEGESIASQVFLNCITNTSFNNKAMWQFKLFPKGCNEGCKTKFCIVLQSLNKFRVKVEGELSIEPYHLLFKKNTLRHVFEGSTLKDGFIKHLDINSCLNNHQELNELSIICKMFLIEDCTFKNSPQESLLEDIGSLLHTKNNCDVILISSEGSEHKAHKAILSCRCPVFLAMFEHNMREKQTSLVKIVDVSSKTLRQMLEFIYTGKIKNIGYDEAKKLLIAADKYELIALKNTCADYLHEKIDIDTAMEIYDFACTYNDLKFLKMDAERYFSKHKKQIMLSKGLEYIKSFSHNTIADLLYSTAVS